MNSSPESITTSETSTSVSLSPFSPNTNSSASAGDHDINNKEIKQQQISHQHRQLRQRRNVSDPPPFPRLYEVMIQARVRSKYELTSSYITDLPEGSIVTVEQILNNRAQISTPINGWLSVNSRMGTNIIMPCNKQTAKIGGKVIMTLKVDKYNNLRSIHNKTCHRKVKFVADIVGYNQRYNLHKIRFKKGNEQWINIEEAGYKYIPQNSISRSSIDPIKQNEQFFTQFFVRDYPQFITQTNSNATISESPSNLNGHCDQHGKSHSDLHQRKLDKKQTEIVAKPKSDRQRVDDLTELKQAMHIGLSKDYDLKFQRGIKQIERRIVEELHKRGLYENNQKFWHFYGMARKAAIAKAEERRGKIMNEEKLKYLGNGQKMVRDL